MVGVCTQAIFGIVEKGGLEGVKTREGSQRLVDGVRKDLNSSSRAEFEMKWVWPEGWHERLEYEENIEAPRD